LSGPTSPISPIVQKKFEKILLKNFQWEKNLNSPILNVSWGELSGNNIISKCGPILSLPLPMKRENIIIALKLHIHAF
jgi:hypothetical protein